MRAILIKLERITRTSSRLKIDTKFILSRIVKPYILLRISWSRLIGSVLSNEFSAIARDDTRYPSERLSLSSVFSFLFLTFHSSSPSYLSFLPRSLARSLPIYSLFPSPLCFRALFLFFSLFLLLFFFFCIFLRGPRHELPSRLDASYPEGRRRVDAHYACREHAYRPRYYRSRDPRRRDTYPAERGNKREREKQRKTEEDEENERETREGSSRRNAIRRSSPPSREIKKILMSVYKERNLSKFKKKKKKRYLKTRIYTCIYIISRVFEVNIIISLIWLRKTWSCTIGFKRIDAFQAAKTESD